MLRGTSQRLVANTVRTPAEQKGGAVEVPKRRSEGHVTQIGLELSRLYERYMSAAQDRSFERFLEYCGSALGANLPVGGLVVGGRAVSRPALGLRSVGSRSAFI